MLPNRLNAPYGIRLDTPIHDMLTFSIYINALQQQGIDMSEILKDSDILVEDLSDAQKRFSYHQIISLFDNIYTLTQNPDIILAAAKHQRLSHFGVFGYAMSSCETLQEALDFATRHIHISGELLERTFRIEGDTAILALHDVLHLEHLLPFFAEYSLTVIHTLTRIMTGKQYHPTRLLLTYSAPSYAQCYNETFNCDHIEFDAINIEFHFDAAILAQPLLSANPLNAAICAQMLEASNATQAHDDPLIQAIKTICITQGQFVNADQMAAQLHISTRTLHRRLAEQKSNYQSILDNIRTDIAINCLTTTSMSMEQIADRVGFSDVSNFRKAFMKWTGTSPSTYRRQH